MSSLRQPSTLAWIVVHLGYPLLPVALEGGIRYLTLKSHLDLDTMNSATLAMSVGLVAIFVNQSIRADEGGVADEIEEDSRNGACTFFSALAIIFFALFAVIVLLQALVIDRGLDPLREVLTAFQWVAIMASMLPIVAAIAAQRTYKLRAALA